MKNKLAQFLTLFALTIGFAIAANAQSGTVEKVNIPFDFIVGDQTFDAGQYTINFGALSPTKSAFLLRSADGKKSAIINQAVAKYSGKIPAEGTFVFFVSNGHYYLAEINTAQRSVEIISPRLREIQKNKKVQMATVR